MFEIKQRKCWTWLFSLPWRILSILSVILWVGEHVFLDSHPAEAPFSPKCQSQGPSSTIFLKTPSLTPLKPLKLGCPWPQTSYTESPCVSEPICWGRSSLSILLQMQNHPSSVTISLSLYHHGNKHIHGSLIVCAHVFLPQLEHTPWRHGFLFVYNWLGVNVTKCT